jgi:cation transport ATPase
MDELLPSRPEGMSSAGRSSAGRSGIPAVSRAIHVSLGFQAVGALLAVAAAVLSDKHPGDEWFGGYGMDAVAWLLAGWSVFWLTCCTALFVALRAHAHGASRAALSRAGLGVLVWLALGVVGVLHLWFVLFAASHGSRMFAHDATVLLCLLFALGVQWAGEIVAMMGVFRMRRRSGR